MAVQIGSYVDRAANLGLWVFFRNWRYFLEIFGNYPIFPLILRRGVQSCIGEDHENIIHR
jgi:hypothetical protein